MAKNGLGGRTCMARQEHIDNHLGAGALLDLAAPCAGERVLDVDCGAFTLELASAVGPAGLVAALDISGPMAGWLDRRAPRPPASPIEANLLLFSRPKASAHRSLLVSCELRLAAHPLAPARGRATIPATPS